MRHRPNKEAAEARAWLTLNTWLNEDGLYFPALLLAFVLASLAVISRRPDALFYPQFFAEDGNIWFADAYNIGWLRALANTHTGYFQTLPRLGAALALAVPLPYAPLITNLVGLVVQVAPAVFLVSRRASNWAPLRIRVLMAAAYVALPNTSELNVSITEAQWHLGLLACLVALSRPPRTRAGVAFDLTTLALCGLTGPFCVVLVPAALAFWWIQRTPWRLTVAIVLGSAALIQSISLLSSAAQTRAPMPLGASFNLFCRILVSQIFLGPLLGMNGALRRGDLYIYAFTAIGLGFLLYCCMRARVEWKLFMVVSALIFAGSMMTPQASYDQPQWVALAGAWGVRYWFFPILAFVWSLVWLAGIGRNRAVRVFAVFALLVMCIHVPRNWRLKAYPDLHFSSEVRAKFYPAVTGTVVSLPIPPGDGWDVTLKKK
ncbi:MAG: hypothetical protein ACJ74Y_14590 [Bryobacteraceae bacterium]